MNFNKGLTVIKGVVDGYFHRVQRETPTQFWINGARQVDLGLALQVGAVGVTANPTHPPRAIKADSEIWYPVIDEILRLNPDLSDDEIADLVTQRIQGRSAKMLYPLYRISNGKYGYVAIQGNPHTNDNLEDIVERGIVYSKLGENIVVKTVSTAVGIKALEELTAKGINTIATEGFSVAQAIKAAEAYEHGLKRTDKKPKCFIVHIAGIFDEYLTEIAEREDIDISSKCIEQAGVVVARSIYRIFQERKFNCMLLAGGARMPRHFTELVGGDLAITISLDTVEDLLLKDPPVVSKIEIKTDTKVLSELESKFVDFRRAYYPDGLTVDEFRSFGPCVKFQNSCLKGYDETLIEIRTRRKSL
jgi:transaldolase